MRHCSGPASMPPEGLASVCARARAGWFTERAKWPDWLRRGLTLVHAAQTAQEEIVMFTLTVAALEVLADPDESPLLDKLSTTERTRLRKGLCTLLDGFDLDENDRKRLTNRMLDTRALGSAQALRNYLAEYEEDPGWSWGWSVRRLACSR